MGRRFDGLRLSTEKLLDGKRLSLDRFEYFDESAAPAVRGMLKSRHLHDGSWERFAYDERGRLARKWSPWKDSPIDSPDDRVVEERYEYQALPAHSPCYILTSLVTENFQLFEIPKT